MATTASATRLRVGELLSRCGEHDSVLPPTTLFNEGWMLRLILDWAAHHRSSLRALSFADGSRWYLEALLPSRFRPRRRGDPAGEGFTHADGVIGHFQLRPGGRGDIELLPGARQLTVVEAKMASGLSVGTKRAPAFDQAARNVACVANLLSIAGIDPGSMTHLGFVLLAPAARIDEGAFMDALDDAAICDAVNHRAAGYDAEAVDWCERWFAQAAQHVSITAVSWESVLADIAAEDAVSGEQLRAFYAECLRYNPLRARPGAAALSADDVKEATEEAEEKVV